MNVKLLRIRNVLGIADAEIEPGDVTLITGRNGEGKTSFLEALKAAVGGGYDASLVRDGADHAEIVLVLDDETEITKRVKRGGGGDISVRHPDFGSIKSPQSYLDGIVDRAFNPASLLTAQPKDRAKVLLEALPMRVTSAQLTEAAGGLRIVSSIDLNRHAIEVIDEAHRRVFEERTGVNRVAKDKRRTANQLLDSVPADFKGAGDAGERLAAKREEHRRAGVLLTERRQAILAESQARITARMQEASSEIEDLMTAVQRAKEASARDIASIKSRAETAIDDALLELQPEANRLAGEVAKLEQQVVDAAKHENTRRIMESSRKEADAAEEEAAGLTAALDGLMALRGKLVSDIPIAGVDVRDGELFVDGHPFHRANRARQVRVAVEIAKLRSGKLRLVCVDESECLDPETFELFMQELERSGCQAFITRVTEGPLEVSAR